MVCVGRMMSLERQIKRNHVNIVRFTPFLSSSFCHNPINHSTHYKHGNWAAENMSHGSSQKKENLVKCVCYFKGFRRVIRQMGNLCDYCCALKVTVCFISLIIISWQIDGRALQCRKGGKWKWKIRQTKKNLAAGDQNHFRGGFWCPWQRICKFSGFTSEFYNPTWINFKKIFPSTSSQEIPIQK